jgi:hypothetical protein
MADSILKRKGTNMDKIIVQATIDLAESGCDYAEVAQVASRRLGRELTEVEFRYICTRCPY